MRRKPASEATPRICLLDVKTPAAVGLAHCPETRMGQIGSDRYIPRGKIHLLTGLEFQAFPVIFPFVQTTSLGYLLRPFVTTQYLGFQTQIPNSHDPILHEKGSAATLTGGSNGNSPKLSSPYSRLVLLTRPCRVTKPRRDQTRPMGARLGYLTEKKEFNKRTNQETPPPYLLTTQMLEHLIDDTLPVPYVHIKILTVALPVIVVMIVGQYLLSSFLIPGVLLAAMGYDGLPVARLLNQLIKPEPTFISKRQPVNISSIYTCVSFQKTNCSI
ncbi:hypothetical protein V8F33_005293 [Rhypophila sp. PSN 637]